MQRSEEKLQEAESRINRADQRAAEAEEALVRKEIERQAVQSELDDLLMVFGDLEERSSEYKRRLKALGENVSDGEEGDEDDEDGTEQPEDDVD